MSIKQEISEYLKECRVFYFSTVDENGAPVTRPLGFQMYLNDQVYLGIGTFKNAYKQLVADPRVYICACKPSGSEWIRLSAKAVLDDDPALVDAAFTVMPDLKPMYESNGWTMGIFHLEDGEVTFVENVMQPVRTETF